MQPAIPQHCCIRFQYPAASSSANLPRLCHPLNLPFIPLIPEGLNLKAKFTASVLVSMLLKMQLSRSRNTANAHLILHRLPLFFFIPVSAAVNLEKLFKMGLLLFLCLIKQRNTLGNRPITKGKLCIFDFILATSHHVLCSVLAAP
jgi:hypothetical protein